MGWNVISHLVQYFNTIALIWSSSYPSIIDNPKVGRVFMMKESVGIDNVKKKNRT